MNARTTGELRASQRDREYTPHEYEEIRALAKKIRERSQRLALANLARPAGLPPQT